MPESTVANSVIGALDRIAGARGRREADGANVAQTQGILLDNEKKQRLLDDDEDARAFGEAYDAGYITRSADNKRFEVTPENAARLADENSALLERLSGKEANPFFSTKGANGNEDITYAGLKRIDAPPQAPVPTLSGIPLEKPQAPATPRYAVQLRKADGSLVPATQNATSAADDVLITLTPEDIAKKLQGRVARMVAVGAAGNDATMQSLRIDYADAVDAEQKAALAAGAPGKLSDDPIAQRGFYGILEDLSGQDLQDAVRDMDLDPDKLEAEARDKWLKQQTNERVEASKALKNNSEDLTAYEGTKEILTNQVARLDKAIADYDANKNKGGYLGSGISIGRGDIGSPAKPEVRKGNEKDSANRTGKNDQARAQLVAERDAAAKQLGGLKQPKRPTMASQMPPTKFAFTEANLRDAVAGKLEGGQPTEEQTAALTKYAKDQGVTSAQDMKKLPKSDAMALAWVIASQSPGTTTEKMSVFESLANFARTGDTKKSPIEAEVAISGALNDTAQVGIAQQNADTNVRNATTAEWKAINDYGKDERDYSLKLAELGYGRSKDLDTELDKQQKRLSVIRLGAMGSDGSDPQSGGVSIKDTGPTPQMADAASAIRGDMEGATLGSPKQIAASKAYLEAVAMYGASTAAFTGKPAWWDLQKGLTNFFMRENGVVPISSMIENIQFDGYVNGVPSKFRILENGPGSKSTEVMAGADTIDRLLGAGAFKALELAATSQRAVNRLQAEGQQVDESTLPAMIATIRKENGAK